MYVCICHAVTDTAIRKAVDDGVNNLRDLGSSTGCGTQCGSCVPLAREIMNEAISQSGSSGTTVSLQVVAS